MYNLGFSTDIHGIYYITDSALETSSQQERRQTPDLTNLTTICFGYNLIPKDGYQFGFSGGGYVSPRNTTSTIFWNTISGQNFLCFPYQTIYTSILAIGQFSVWSLVVSSTF